jgi:phosphoglycolate phosphatase-like HAD superfamily hydrolase
VTAGAGPGGGRTLRIGIDLDDVLAESLPGFLAAFERRFGIHTPLARGRWELFDDRPHLRAADRRAFYADLMRTDFLGTRPPDPEGLAAVRALHAAGHHLVLVTSRPTAFELVTRRWLARHRIAGCFAEVVHRDGAQRVAFKPRVARERSLGWFIEDELPVAVALARAGVRVLLMDRPWNRGPRPGAIIPVASWPEALERIAALARAATGNA